MPDIFICHAHADKERIVKPLVERLEERGITYWLDQIKIGWGDSIVRRIGEGLLQSRFVVVMISEVFLTRGWPKTELEYAMNAEISSKQTVVLPIVSVPLEQVFNTFPLLRNKRCLRMEDGFEPMMHELERLLGHHYKTEWTYSHPAEYSGPVWIRVIAKRDNRNREHKFDLRWGPWRYKHRHTFSEKATASFVHAKADDGKSVPIRFRVTPAACVQFGQGDPPDPDPVDINYGWHLVLLDR